MDKENSKPRGKRLKLKNTAIRYRHLSSVTATVSPSKRFGHASAEDLPYLSEKQNLQNTDQNTKWAVKTFAAWREYHNGDFGDKCPDDLLKTADPKLLDKWLSTFIVQIRRADGHLYPPKTLDNILSGLLRYIRSLPLENPPNFLAQGHCLGNCLPCTAMCTSHSNPRSHRCSFAGCYNKQRRVRSAVGIQDTRKRHS